MFLVWNVIVYTGALWMLGVEPTKALIVGLIATATLFLRYGSRWVSRFGFGLMVVALAVWVGVFPTPDHWMDSLRQVRVALFHP